MQIEMVQPTSIEVKLAMSLEEWEDLITALSGKGEKSRRTPQEVKLIAGLADDLALAIGIPRPSRDDSRVQQMKRAILNSTPAPRMLDGDPPPPYAGNALS